MASLKLLAMLFLSFGMTSADPEASPEARQQEAFLPGPGGCGPPRMLSSWSNRTVQEGDMVRLSCPLDMHNSCLVDMVEWYHSLRSKDAGRALLRDAAVAFDPLLMVMPSVSSEQAGWYTCVVANGEGRKEMSTYLDVRAQSGARHSPPPPPRASAPRTTHTKMAHTTTTPRTTTTMTPLVLEVELPEYVPPQGGVEERFPVYSRFRGQRVDWSQRPQYEEMRQKEIEIAPAPLRRTQDYNDEQVTINQHIEYIHDKVNSLESKLSSIEDRLQRLERA